MPTRWGIGWRHIERDILPLYNSSAQPLSYWCRSLAVDSSRAGQTDNQKLGATSSAWEERNAPFVCLLAAQCVPRCALSHLCSCGQLGPVEGLGLPVSIYKCFLVSPEGKIEAIEIVEARKDPDALAQARDLLKSKRQIAFVEVWKGGRLVDRLWRE